MRTAKQWESFHMLCQVTVSFLPVTANYGRPSPSLPCCHDGAIMMVKGWCIHYNIYIHRCQHQMHTVSAINKCFANWLFLLITRLTRGGGVMAVPVIYINHSNNDCLPCGIYFVSTNKQRGWLIFSVILVRWDACAHWYVTYPTGCVTSLLSHLSIN